MSTTADAAASRPRALPPSRRRYPELASAEWLADRYAADGPTAVADQLGCTVAAVYAALARHGIPLRHHYGPERRKLRAAPSDVVEVYLRVKSVAAAAEELGVSPLIARTALRRAGVNPMAYRKGHISDAHQRRAPRTLKDPDAFRALVDAHHGNASAMAREVGVSVTSVRFWAERHGISLRSAVAFEGRDQEMVALVRSGVLAKDVAAKFGVHPAQVTRALRRAGLTARVKGGAPR